jgi:hypothetical protein
VLPGQISQWTLPTRPTKMQGSLRKRAERHGEISVELDAIPADRLRSIVRDAIERHIDPETLKAAQAAEESERQMLDGLVGMLDRIGFFKERG